MSDKEMISKAFASLKAPDDTLERIEEKMNHTSNQKGNLRHKRLTLVLAALLVLALGTAGAYAVKSFRLGNVLPASGDIINADGLVVKQQEAGDVLETFAISVPFAAQNPHTGFVHDGIDFGGRRDSGFGGCSWSSYHCAVRCAERESRGHRP